MTTMTSIEHEKETSTGTTAIIDLSVRSDAIIEGVELKESIDFDDLDMALICGDTEGFLRDLEGEYIGVWTFDGATDN